MIGLGMDTATMIAGFAILGTVLGLVFRGWTSIKSFFQNVLSLLIDRTNLGDQSTNKAVLAYLLKYCKRTKRGVRNYSSRYEHLRKGKFAQVAFEDFTESHFLFWKGWMPIWFIVSKPKEDDKKQIIFWGAAPRDNLKCSLVSIHGTVNVEEIVTKATDERNEVSWAVNDKERRRFFVKKIPDATAPPDSTYHFSAGSAMVWFHEGIYKLLAYTPEELGQQQATTGKAIDSLYYPDHIKDLIKEIELWRNMKEWYIERGMPWKRGWVLYGPPGTGKSALVRAFAEDLDMPLFSYQLGRLTNTDLEKSWSEMRSHAPCIAIFEDFDNVFHGRENIYNKPTLVSELSKVAKPPEPATTDAATGRLSFDCLLNCIDGVDKSNGIFTVITTNHIEYIDPALGIPLDPNSTVSSRPGRIDRVIELTYMTKEDKLRLAKRVLFDDEIGYQIVVALVLDSQTQETPAQFQEWVGAFALRRFMNRRELESRN